MDVDHSRSAERARRMIGDGRHDHGLFRQALLAVPPAARDRWFDRVLGLGDVQADGPQLPRGCVPYLPCPVDALIQVVELAPVAPADVFVDVGSGIGRAMTLVHLLTGAAAIGVEIQSALVRAARDLGSRLPLASISHVEGDATTLAGAITSGSVFFLYCPFSGERLSKLLDKLEAIAATRAICICCVDLPLPPLPWLAQDRAPAGSLTIHRSRSAQPLTV